MTLHNEGHAKKLTELNLHLDLLPRCPEENENSFSMRCSPSPHTTTKIHTFLWTIRSCLFRFMSSSYSWCSWTLVGCLLPSTGRQDATLVRQRSHSGIHNGKTYDHVQCEIHHSSSSVTVATTLPIWGDSHNMVTSWPKSCHVNTLRLKTCDCNFIFFHQNAPHLILCAHKLSQAQDALATQAALSKHF